MYNQNIHLKFSVIAENATNASEQFNTEVVNASNDRILRELTEERFRG